MRFSKLLWLALLFLFSIDCLALQSENPLLQKGWEALVKDNESEAFSHFYSAFEKANKENNTADKAESLLYMGICSYGSSLEKGLTYVTQALSEFKKLETKNANQALVGRNKCLQLISTIYSRQKKYSEAKKLSKEVVETLQNSNDKTGTLGLAYNSLGTLYEIGKNQDSAAYFFKLALSNFEKNNNSAYLPTAYLKLGNLAKQKKQNQVSYNYFSKALKIANATQNKQAQVLCTIALGKWFQENEKNNTKAINYLKKAKQISTTLSDKTFEIKALEAIIEVQKQENNYQEVSKLQAEIIQIKDNYYSFEREHIAKNIEVQFEVSEKDRKLELISKQKQVANLTNYLLITLLSLLVIGFLFFKRIYKRDKLLLATKEKLVVALEEQKKLKQKQFENDLEHKESQLSAITIQMLQKNEIVDEIKSVIQNKEATSEKELTKIISRFSTQDANWKDFDNYFESVNKNFYAKLKQNFPEISANDLKICALIKLNLSIKEMASILNISPDSVKTARHRLRKKLQLSTEENLTDFILKI